MPVSEQIERVVEGVLEHYDETDGLPLERGVQRSMLQGALDTLWIVGLVVVWGVVLHVVLWIS